MLASEQMEAILEHARRDYPNEACGLLGGADGRVIKVYPLANVKRSPVLYEADSAGVLEALMDMEDRGWEPSPLGIYHSHPRSPAFPSPTDVNRAYYPDSIYLILSLQSKEQPDARAFRIVDGEIADVLVIVEK